MGTGAAGLGALAMIPGSSAFNIRTSNPLEYYGNDQNNPNFSVQPDGTLQTQSLSTDDATVNNSLTDASGTQHTGQLADDGDAQPPESHGSGSHDAEVIHDGDGTDRDYWVIANGASDPAGASNNDLIFEEES